MKLFAPQALRELALPNRIVISPMCQYSANDDAWLALRDRLARAAAGSDDDRD